MPRTKKDGIKVTFYLEQGINKLLEAYSSETGIPKSVVVEKAIKQYIEKNKKNKAED